MFHIFLNMFDIFIYMFDVLIDIVIVTSSGEQPTGFVLMAKGLTIPAPREVATTLSSSRFCRRALLLQPASSIRSLRQIRWGLGGRSQAITPAPN